jgi:hypothetical protein
MSNNLNWVTKIVPIPNDIQKFWKNNCSVIAGFIGETSIIYNASDEEYYSHMPTPLRKDLLAMIETDKITKNKIVSYFLNDNWHTESQMIRLIKLKEFL